jgi:hypothetical protein
MDISERLSFFAALFQVDKNPVIGMWILYVFIYILAIIVYKLGFATKLPLLKSLILYIVLALGCTLLTFLAVFLPVSEGLAVTALLLIAYRLRNRQKEHGANIN